MRSIATIVEDLVPQYLAIPPVTKRGSGALQARIRRGLYKRLVRAIRKEWKEATLAQCDQAWDAMRELAELQRNAQPIEEEE